MLRQLWEPFVDNHDVIVGEPAEDQPFPGLIVRIASLVVMVSVVWRRRQSRRHVGVGLRTMGAARDVPAGCVQDSCAWTTTILPSTRSRRPRG